MLHQAAKPATAMNRKEEITAGKGPCRRRYWTQQRPNIGQPDGRGGRGLTRGSVCRPWWRGSVCCILCYVIMVITFYSTINTSLVINKKFKNHMHEFIVLGSREWGLQSGVKNIVRGPFCQFCGTRGTSRSFSLRCTVSPNVSVIFMPSSSDSGGSFQSKWYMRFVSMS